MTACQLPMAHRARAPRVPDDRGAALIFALLGIVAISALGLGLVSLSVAGMTASENERDTARALAVADAGIAHARKLILWREWQSFDQFLQNDAGSNAGVGCTGDELVDAPGGPLPPGYPTSSADFIPAAGLAFGGGSYQVFVCDDDATDWDTSVTPAVLDTDPGVDVNKRIIVRSVGTGPNGATATVELVIAGQDLPALIVNGDLAVPGNPHLTGAGGAAFANGAMALAGDACAEQFFGSVGSVGVSGSSVGTGAGCSNAALDIRPDSPPLNIPLISPNDYKALATYWLESDGNIYDPATGLPFPPGAVSGWSFSNQTWSSNSNIPAGTYWVNGNVVMGGSPGTAASPLPMTILATQSVDIGGSPDTVPALTVSDIGNVPVGISVIAGTDLLLAGSSSQQFTGIYYAAHQLNISGSPAINGQVLAYNLADTSYPPGNTNKVALDAAGRMVITGSPTINFTGSGIVGTAPVAWRECRTTTNPANPCGPLWGG